jgi:hypothetical protein
MKRSSSPWRKTLLIALLIVAGWWFVYDRSITNDELVELKRELSVSKERIVELESELLAGKKQREAMKKQSFKGILEETNKVVVDGWQQLLDTVNQELGKARNEVKDVLGKIKQEEGDQNTLKKPEKDSWETLERLKNEKSSSDSDKTHET